MSSGKNGQTIFRAAFTIMELFTTWNLKSLNGKHCSFFSPTMMFWGVSHLMDFQGKFAMSKRTQSPLSGSLLSRIDSIHISSTAITSRRAILDGSQFPENLHGFKFKNVLDKGSYFFKCANYFRVSLEPDVSTIQFFYENKKVHKIINVDVNFQGMLWVDLNLALNQFQLCFNAW